MTILDQPDLSSSPLPLEDLIPEARQLTRRRSLRVSAGVRALGFVNGSRHVPEGPANTHVDNDQRVKSLELFSTASVVATIWSNEPAIATRQCGTWLPESGVNLIYGATTLFVSTFPSSPANAWPSTGTCSRRSTFIEYAVGA